MRSFLRQLLEEYDFMDPQPQDADPYDDGAAALHDLFVRGETILLRRAGCVIPDRPLAALIQAGLLRKKNGRVQSLLQAQNYRGLVLLSDFFEEDNKTGFVLQVGPSGNYLANLTPRKAVVSVLDLGCGCGVQGLLAAKHCQLVTATDVNPRALQMTRLNAEINGITNIEILEGSYLEPVKGRSFDLIVANIPYVITPENKYLYRDTGDARDTNLFALLREIPSSLNENGYAHLVANWIVAPDRPYWQPFQTALEGLPVDTWLFHNESKTTADYVEMWLDVPQSDSVAYEQKKNDWLAWYQEQQIELIALGAITVRRRTTAKNWGCSATITEALRGPVGAQISDLFQSQDDLDFIDRTSGLQNARLVSFLADGSVTPLDNGRVLCCSAGMEIPTEIQASSIEVINFLDGSLTLGEAIELAIFMPDTIFDDIRALMSVGIIRVGAG